MITIKLFVPKIYGDFSETVTIEPGQTINDAAMKTTFFKQQRFNYRINGARIGPSLILVRSCEIEAEACGYGGKA